MDVLGPRAFLCACAEGKAWDAVCYLPGSAAAARRGRGFLGLALPLARMVRIGLTQRFCGPAELAPSQPPPPHPQQLPSCRPLRRRGGYLRACGKGDWLLGTAHRMGQKTRSSTLNLLIILLGLPGFTGNEAGLLGEGDQNTAMAKRPCIDTEAG